MRDQGRLVEWFDEKGYGFIQPNDESKGRVFLHIKDFARPGPRPIQGCALEYIVQLDGQGRYKAKQVTYLKAAQTKKNKYAQKNNKNQVKQKMQPMQIAIISYILFLAVFVLAGLLSALMVLIVLLMNLITYGLYSHDKAAAQQGSQRVPENTLHLVSILGGWPSAWLAQQRLRHKTQKQPFKKIYFCTIAFNILIVFWLISPLSGLN